MTAVRRATAADVLRIVDWVERLVVAVGGPVSVNRAWTARTIAGLMTDQSAVVFVTDGGFIAGAMRPTIINPEPVACEMGWFATDRSGLALLRAFEGWAHERGARLIQLSTGAAGPDLARLGYKLTERAWVKA